MAKFLIRFCVALSTLVLFSGTLAAAEKGSQSVLNPDRLPLKISTVRENAPFSLVLPDGTPTGLYVEFWELWSKTNNIPVIFLPTSFKQNLKALKAHQVDFHAGLFINHERSKWADFSIPIHRVRTGIFFHSEQKVTPPLSELKGSRIGVQKGTFQADMLVNKYPNIEVVVFEDARIMVSALLDKKITALVSESPYLKTELGRMGLSGVLIESPENFTTNEVHALFPKGTPELVKIVDEGIRKIPLSKLIELEKKWLPEDEPFFQNLALKNFPELSLAQQQWLNVHPQLSLGTDPAWPPFEFNDDNGNYAGISSDYVRVIEEKLALKMTPLKNLSWVEVINKAKRGEVDVLPAVVKTPARESFLSFTEPYITFPMIIATRKDAFFIQELKELNHKKVGVVQSYITHELLNRDFPEIELKYFETVSQGLIDLDEGKIDAFVENLGVITHQINQDNFNNIKIAAITPYKLELAIGVRKELEPLVPILNKVLSSMTTRQKASIANSWLSYQVNFSENISTFLYWAISVGALLSLIILYVWNNNRRLQYEIQERKNIEASLELARNTAVAANKAKDEFLANMSHEIRTPMNAVVGMAHLLGASDLNDEQKSYIKALNKSSDSLLVLINDILDLSKIEAGKLKLENRAFNLKHLVEDITKQTRLKISANKLSVSLNFYDDVPHEVCGDAQRLSQILHNLINNAVKFTDRGEINISVKIFHENTSNHTLQFTISDTGIGLTEEQQMKLFQTYTQADSSITRKYGGTGLGLSICQNLCGLMQGSIWVESQFGKGSQFNFTATFEKIKPAQAKQNGIAIDSTQSETEAEIDINLLANKKILVVDDNEVNLTIARKVLSNQKMQVYTVNNGEEAIKALSMALTSAPFDIVLMDIQMPVLDGYSATKRIRRNTKLQQIPIIAMSANVMESDIQQALDSGMNAHIGKPLRINEMLKIIGGYINKS